MIKYFGIIKDSPLWPVLSDCNRKVMSLPPVVNSKYSQITVDTRDILVEVTSSTSVPIVKEVLNELLRRFGMELQNVGRGEGEVIIVEQVEIKSSEDGHSRMKYPLQRDLEEICKEKEKDPDSN